MALPVLAKSTAFRSEFISLKSLPGWK